MVESHGLYSPDVSERFTISRENSSIGFGPVCNVVIHLSAPSDVENERERDSSDVHTKVIMDHKGDIRFLRGPILTSNGPIVGFRSIHEAVGESMNLINIQTKQRHRFKDFPFRTVDLAFAQHKRFLAVLNADSSLYIFEVQPNCENKKYLSISNWPTIPSRGNDQLRLSWCPYIEGEEDEDDSHMVAVYIGRQLYIVNIGVLKESSLGIDMDFEDANKEEGGLFTHYFSEQPENPDLRISAVSMSPDSTAVAIALSEGAVQFFTFNEENNTLRAAHCFEPRGFARAGKIDDLIFLDDLTPDRKVLPFWRSCVVVSNDGRKLALYECQGWRCLGKISFETTLAVNKFVCIQDPSAQFVHLLDVDGMNLYTVEIHNPFRSNELPRFVGITQTSFCHPIFSISPISVNTFETADDSADDLFNNSNSDDSEEEDEESEGGDGQKRKKSKRYFVAMGKRSMVELQLTIRRHNPSPASSTAASDKEPSPALHAEASDHQEQEQQKLQHLLQHSPAPPQQGLLQMVPPQIQAVSVPGLEAVNKKLDDVLTYLQAIELERKQRDEQLVQRIVAGLDENQRMREGYMLNRIEQLCENGRLDTIAALRTGFVNLNGQIENSVRSSSAETSDYISQRVGIMAKSGLTECLLPAFERSCEILFERLNEHFRQGINEYLTTSSQMIQGTAMATMQMAVQQQQQKSEMDRIALLQMIETAPEAALEAALNKADASILEFVISKINPEKILMPGNTKLSQTCLLSLVQQFTVSLHRDRDLKFKWIELVIPEIDMTDPEITILVAPIAQQLVQALQEIMETMHEEQQRRYIRLLCQMTRSSLLQAHTPSQRTFAATSALSKYVTDHSHQQ